MALRLFNAYGPGQALSNPYTGVLAIFASRLLNGKRPIVFEDGQQRRISSTSLMSQMLSSWRWSIRMPQATSTISQAARSDQSLRLRSASQSRCAETTSRRRSKAKFARAIFGTVLLTLQKRNASWIFVRRRILRKG